MAQVMGPTPGGELTDQDKLMAALSYPLPIIAIIILLMEEMKDRPFQKFHAVQALAVNIVLWVILIILSCVLGAVIGAVTFGIGTLCGFVPWLLWFVTLYWAYLAYQGQYFDIPVITDFVKKQGWV